MPPTRSSPWSPRLPLLWAVTLTVGLLWPVLGRGYVLSYDMVWVPDLAVRPDFFGLGSGLPRAVPSDAVVAVLDEVVPGMLLQKLVLLGGLVAAGVGATRLVPTRSTVAQLVAVTMVVWNPFVAERLALGHWPVLLGYAVLPWLVVAAQRMREQGRFPPGAGLLLLMGSLSAGAGLVSAGVLLAFGLGGHTRRVNLIAVSAVIAANAPWVVAGLLHASAATSDPAGARAFGLHDEGGLPGPLAAVGLGGVWNAQVVPGSRATFLAWAGLLFLVALVATGARTWAVAAGARYAWAAGACWVLGWGIAVLTWAAPDLVAGTVASVPGAGLVRDGARFLALCVPALVGAAATGAAVAHARLRGAARRVSCGVALVLLPVALMPDVAGGLGGRLVPVVYPSSYDDARSAVAGVEVPVGDVLVLPFSSYRAPEWNGGRPVLDPLGRVLTRDYVASDRLVVSGVPVEGEDPRGPRVREALASPTAMGRARALARAGIGVVVTDRTTTERPPMVSGERLPVRGDIGAVRLDGVVEREVPRWWVAAVAAAWCAFLALGVTDLLRLALRRRLRRRGRRLPTGTLPTRS